MRRFLGLIVVLSVGLAGFACTPEQVDQFLDEEAVTIHFESEGDVSVESIDALKGVPPTSLPEPERPGYTFDGWYVDADFTTTYSEEAVRESDGNLTLYAQWAPLEGDELEILFETGVGEPMASMRVDSGTVIEDHTILPDTMENYMFDGWYVDDTFTTAFDYDTPVEDHMRLYALWLPTYTVNFYDDDDTLLHTARVTEGYDADYGGDTPEKAATEAFEYVFDGWDASLENITEATDFHPVFTEVARGYTVSYHASDHTTVAHSETVQYGETVPSHTPEPEDGYAFDGWYTDDTLATAFDPASTVSGDLSLFGLWTLLHEVRFLDASGDVLETVEVRDGGTATYSGDTPVKAPTVSTEYAFDGWDGALDDIDAPTDFNPTFTEKTRTYTVTYYKADGTTVEHTEEADYGSTVSAHVPGALTGYEFDGWFTDDTHATEHDFTATIEGDVDIYGAWSETEPLVTFAEIRELEGGAKVRTRGIAVQKNKDTLFDDLYVYLLYDGSDYAWVQAGTDFADVDEAIVFDATLFVDGYLDVRFLVSPLNVETDATFTATEPAPLTLSVKEIFALLGDDTLPLGTPVVVSGFYQTPKSSFDPYWVYDPFTEQIVNVTNMDPDTITALEDNEDLPVTIGGRIAIHAPEDGEVYMIQDPTVGVSEPVELTGTMVLDYLEDAILSTFDGMIVESEEALVLIDSDPFFASSLTWRTVGDNASLYDMETSQFAPTDTTVEVGFEVDIEYGTMTRTVPFTITLEPITITTAKAVHETLEEGEEAWVEGLVVYAKDYTLIIKDDTGYLTLDLYEFTGTHAPGDIVRMKGYKSEVSNLVVLQGSVDRVSVIGSGEVSHDVAALSFETIAAADPDILMETEYVEISGVLVDSSDYDAPYMLKSGAHSILLKGDFSDHPTLLEDHYGETITLNGYLFGFRMLSPDETYTMVQFDHVSGLSTAATPAADLLDIVQSNITKTLEAIVLREDLQQTLPENDFGLGLDIDYALGAADAPYGEILVENGSQILTPLDETVGTLTLEVTITRQTGGETATFTVTLPVEPYDIITVDALLESPESTEGMVDIIILAKTEYSGVLAMDATTHTRFLMTSQYDPWMLEDYIGERHYVEGLFEEGLFIATQITRHVDTPETLPISPLELTLTEAWNLDDVTDFPFVEITAPAGIVGDPIEYVSLIGDTFNMKLFTHYELAWTLNALVALNDTPTLTLQGYLIPTNNYGADPMFLAVSALNPGVTTATVQEINDGMVNETYETFVYFDSQTDGVLVMADETGVLYACNTTRDYSYEGLDLLGNEMLIHGVLIEQDGLRCLDGDPLVHEPDLTYSFDGPSPVASSVAAVADLPVSDYGQVYEISGILRETNGTFYIEDGDKRLEIANSFDAMAYGFQGLEDTRIIINVYPLNALGTEGDRLVYHPDWEHDPDYAYPLTDVERADLVFDELKADVKSEYLSLEPIVLKGDVDYFSDYGYGENLIDWSLEPGSEGTILDLDETYDPMKRIAYTDTTRPIELTLTVSAKDENGDPYVLSHTFLLNVTPYEDEMMTLPDFLAASPGTQAVLALTIIAYDDFEDSVLMSDGTHFIYAKNPGYIMFPDGEEVLIHATYGGITDNRHHISEYSVLSDSHPAGTPSLTYAASNLTTIAALDETDPASYGEALTVEGRFKVDGDFYVVTDGVDLTFNLADSLEPYGIDHDIHLDVPISMDIIVYSYDTTDDRWVLYLTDFTLVN